MNKQKNNQTKEKNHGSGSQIDTTFIQVGAFPSRFSVYEGLHIVQTSHRARKPCPRAAAAPASTKRAAL